MADILSSQLTHSRLSLDGTSGLSKRAFGYKASGAEGLLHNSYSENSLPLETLIDFNGSSTVRPESHLDELDILAPKNLHPLDQNFNSSIGQTYSDKGPAGGHF